MSDSNRFMQTRVDRKCESLATDCFVVRLGALEVKCMFEDFCEWCRSLWIFAYANLYFSHEGCTCTGAETPDTTFNVGSSRSKICWGVFGYKI